MQPRRRSVLQNPSAFYLMPEAADTSSIASVSNAFTFLKYQERVDREKSEEDKVRREEQRLRQLNIHANGESRSPTKLITPIEADEAEPVIESPPLVSTAAAVTTAPPSRTLSAASQVTSPKLTSSRPASSPQEEISRLLQAELRFEQIGARKPQMRTFAIDTDDDSSTAVSSSLSSFREHVPAMSRHVTSKAEAAPEISESFFIDTSAQPDQPVTAESLVQLLRDEPRLAADLTPSIEHYVASLFLPVSSDASLESSRYASSDQLLPPEHLHLTSAAMDHLFMLDSYLNTLPDRSPLRSVLRILSTHRLLLQAVTASTATSDLTSHPLVPVTAALLTPPPKVPTPKSLRPPSIPVAPLSRPTTTKAAAKVDSALPRMALPPRPNSTLSKTETRPQTMERTMERTATDERLMHSESRQTLSSSASQHVLQAPLDTVDLSLLEAMLSIVYADPIPRPQTPPRTQSPSLPAPHSIGGTTARSGATTPALRGQSRPSDLIRLATTSLLPLLTMQAEEHSSWAAGLLRTWATAVQRPTLQEANAAALASQNEMLARADEQLAVAYRVVSSHHALRDFVHRYLPQGNEVKALVFQRWRQFAKRNKRARTVMSAVADRMFPVITPERAFRAWAAWCARRFRYRRTVQLRRLLLDERQRQKQLAIVQRYMEKRAKEGDEQLKINFKAVLAAEADSGFVSPDDLAEDLPVQDDPVSSDEEVGTSLASKWAAIKKAKEAAAKQRESERRLQRLRQSMTRDPSAPQNINLLAPEAPAVVPAEPVPTTASAKGKSAPKPSLTIKAPPKVMIDFSMLAPPLLPIRLRLRTPPPECDIVVARVTSSLQQYLNAMQDRVRDTHALLLSQLPRKFRGPSIAQPTMAALIKSTEPPAPVLLSPKKNGAFFPSSPTGKSRAPAFPTEAPSLLTLTPAFPSVKALALSVFVDRTLDLPPAPPAPVPPPPPEPPRPQGAKAPSAAAVKAAQAAQLAAETAAAEAAALRAAYARNAHANGEEDGNLVDAMSLRSLWQHDVSSLALEQYLVAWINRVIQSTEPVQPPPPPPSDDDEEVVQPVVSKFQLSSLSGFNTPLLVLRLISGIAPRLFDFDAREMAQLPRYQQVALVHSVLDQLGVSDAYEHVETLFGSNNEAMVATLLRLLLLDQGSHVSKTIKEASFGFDKQRALSSQIESVHAVVELSATGQPLPGGTSAALQTLLSSLQSILNTAQNSFASMSDTMSIHALFDAAVTHAARLLDFRPTVQRPHDVSFWLARSPAMQAPVQSVVSTVSTTLGHEDETHKIMAIWAGLPWGAPGSMDHLLSDEDAEDTARKLVNHAKELAMLRTKGLPEPPAPAADPAAHVHSMQVFDHHADSITVMMTSPFEFARLKLLLGGFTVEDIMLTSRLIQFHRVPLHRLFELYSRNDCMSLADFSRFMNDLKLPCKSSASVLIIFSHVARSASSFIRFGDFLDLLVYVAQFSAATGTLAARFETVCLAILNQSVVEPTPSFRSSVLHDRDMVFVFRRHERSLLRVFRHFASIKSIAGLSALQEFYLPEHRGHVFGPECFVANPMHMDRGKALERVHVVPVALNCDDWNHLVKTVNITIEHDIFSAATEGRADMNYSDFLVALCALASAIDPDPMACLHDRVHEVLVREVYPPMMQTVKGLKSAAAAIGLDPLHAQM